MSELPINELKIVRFRGLRDVELSDCARINLLVGENNSGKTTVLDALSLFCRPLDIANWREAAWRREVKSSRTPLTNAFIWLFPQFQESNIPNPHSIWIYGKGLYPGRRLMAEFSEFESYGNGSEEDIDEASVREESEGAQGLEIRVLADYAQIVSGEFDETCHLQDGVDFKVIDNQRFNFSTRVDHPFTDIGYISPFTHRTSQDITWYLSQALQKEASDQDIRADITDVLREIDPGVQKFEIIDTGRTTSTIIIKHKDTGMTPVSAFGDGMRRALLIAATIPAIRGGVLLIDEIEAALHVSVLDSVLRVLRWAADRYNVQVFATTHSLEAVDAVTKAFENDEESLALYRLRHEEDRIQARRLAGKMIREMRYEGGLDVR